MQRWMLTALATIPGLRGTVVVRELWEEVFLRFGGNPRLFAARAALPSESLAFGLLEAELAAALAAAAPEEPTNVEQLEAAVPLTT